MELKEIHSTLSLLQSKKRKTKKDLKWIAYLENLLEKLQSNP